MKKPSARPRSKWDAYQTDFTATAEHVWTEPYPEPYEWTGLYDKDGEPIYRHLKPHPVGFLHSFIPRGPDDDQSD